jgi:HAD superfamily hydrolase (TIGR01509 family)
LNPISYETEDGYPIPSRRRGLRLLRNLKEEAGSTPPKRLRFHHLKADLEATLLPFFSKEEMDRAIRLIRKRYEEVYPDKAHLLDGAKEVLEMLDHKGIALALTSNEFGRFSKGALTHLGVAGYFKSILVAENGPWNKPCPDMIHASLKAMDPPPEAVVFVGDSLQDIETGRRAGVHVYALPTGLHRKKELSQGRPRSILKHFDELIPLVGNSGNFFR